MNGADIHHTDRHVLLATAAAALTISGACSTSGGSDSNGGGGTTPPSPTQLCEAECIPQFPEGEGSYYAIRACILCGACSDSCNGAQNPNCEGVVTVEDTCSTDFPECASCANDGCAYEQLPDTTITGACANEVTGCINTPTCVSLFNCVVTCLGPNTGTGGAGMGGAAAGGVGTGGTP